MFGLSIAPPNPAFVMAERSQTLRDDFRRALCPRPVHGVGRQESEMQRLGPKPWKVIYFWNSKPIHSMYAIYSGFGGQCRHIWHTWSVWEM